MAYFMLWVELENSMRKFFLLVALSFLSQEAIAQEIDYRGGLSGKEVAYARNNIDGLAVRLNDPKSAVFEDVFVSRKAGPPVVCGLVNAKNSFGGYAGRERFVVAGDLSVFESEMGLGEMQKLWRQVCE